MYSNKLIYSSIYIGILVAGLEALCVQCDEKFKRCYLQVFARKSILYWVSTNPGSNRVRMKKSLFVLAGLPKLSVDFLAVFGVWSLMDFLQCGCRCRYRQVLLLQVQVQVLLQFLLFCVFHVFSLSFCKIQNWTEKYFVLS